MKKSPAPPVKLTGASLVTANESHLMGVFSLMYTQQRIKTSSNYTLLQRYSKIPAEVMLIELRQFQKKSLLLAVLLSAILILLYLTLRFLVSDMLIQNQVICVGLASVVSVAVYGHFYITRKPNDEVQQIALSWERWRKRFEPSYFFSSADLRMLKSIYALLEVDCDKCALTVPHRLPSYLTDLFNDLLSHTNSDSMTSHCRTLTTVQNYTDLAREIGLCVAED